MKAPVPTNEQERLQALRSSGIIVYDRELRYKVFNPFMERLTGKRAKEVLGRIAVEVFPRLRTNGIEALNLPSHCRRNSVFYRE